MRAPRGGLPVRARIGVWAAAAVLSGSGSGCVEWLEVDDEAAADEARAALRAEAPVFPSQPPAPEGECLLLPNTSGLRVPEGAGYWTRARLEALDAVLPCSTVVFHRVEGLLHVRFEAAGDLARDGRAVRFVTSVRLPGATAVEDLMRVDLQPLAEDTVASFRTSSNDLWMITIDRLTFETITHAVVAGSFEGIARRGSGGQRERRVEVGFIAMRAPEADGPMPTYPAATPVPLIPEPGRVPALPAAVPAAPAPAPAEPPAPSPAENATAPAAPTPPAAPPPDAPTPP
jgi:hypothetical protein